MKHETDSSGMSEYMETIKEQMLELDMPGTCLWTKQ